MKRKNSGSVLLSFICTILLFGFLTVFMIIDSMPMFLNQYEDFYELEKTSGVNKDDYVSIYVDGVIGNYAETKHYTNLIPTGKDEHYIIWLENDEIISLAVKKKRIIEQMDLLTDATWAYIDAQSGGDTSATLPQGITLKGRIRTMDSEIKGYYQQCLDELGISSENMKIYYVNLDTTSTVAGNLMLIIFGVLLTGIGVFGTVDELKKRKLAKEIQQGDNEVSSGVEYDSQISSFDNPVNDDGSFEAMMGSMREDD
ncbi:MAG: DUF6709 family protein [Lachnospiraceae bacterium]